MSLSLASRRRTQTAATTRQQLPVRKQHSFIEPATSTGNYAGKYTAQQRGYLSRGLSVGRSIENIRQKLYVTPTLERQKLSGVGHLSRQQTVGECPAKFAASVVNSKPTAGVAQQQKDKTLLAAAWSSTSMLLADGLHKQELQPTDQSQRSPESTAKADKNKINLNIVLSQTIRATNEPEAGHSDIESAADSSELPVAKAQLAISSGSNALSVSPALTVERRPPLVRAMSAPVRGLDENSKSVLAANKRQQKLRRRKILTRNISCDRSPTVDNSSLLLSVESAQSAASSSSKKLLTRARSVVSADVITLVSLLSSEGSDSEREDNSSASTPAGGVNEKQQQQQLAPTQSSPTRRPPLLRKTGKSVSFQDSYPPTFQLASKEYSHMIRRGSIAPLAARIRANRPPTAPPVSIFLSEQRQPAEAMAEPPTAAEQPTSGGEKENHAGNCNVALVEPAYNYPSYVRSIKERECWKLFQKMCGKGVHVSYDTVLRGMLTPTEFRHFQKQREHEQAKALEAAEAAEAAAAAAAEQKSKEQRKLPASVAAIERLSDAQQP